MDVHDTMYYAATTAAGGTMNVDDDETDLYDEALRSRPRPQQDGIADLLPTGGGSYDDYYISKNNFGIAVGIFCIGLLQFHAPIRRWIRHQIHRLRSPSGGTELSPPTATPITTTTPQALLDWLLWFVISVLDYLWVAYQIAVNTLRDQWLTYNNSTTSTSRHGNNRNSRSRCNSLPELEDCSLSAAHDASVAAATMETLWPQHHEQSTHQIHPPIGAGDTKNNYNNNTNLELPLPDEIENWDWGPIPVELEPAFLEESRYPQDWMVYHPKLRVIQRTTALRYDCEYATSKQQPQQAPEKVARHSVKNIAPVGNSLASPSSFEDEKKDDIAGHDVDRGAKNAVCAASNRPLEGNTNLDSSPTLRRANETSRQQQRSTNSKADMPILRSVVAT